jgi:phage major head subunit gpT-like protein
MVVDTISLEKGLRLEFNKAYAELAGKYAEGLGRLITVTKSTHNNEKYGLFGDVPSVKEWIGDKTAGNLEDYDYTITNKDWYTAISLDRNEIEDDEMGLLPPRIQLMVKVIRDYRAELVANLIINGTTNLAYDGSAFFANRTAPNDNLLTGTGTTVAQLQTDIGVARAAMRKF